MSNIQQLLTAHLDVWAAADTGKKSGRGRSSSSAASVYGIKKLRELILDLAVRGKLVPQDANEEPASELLKRVQSDKDKLIAEGKIKKNKQLPPIADNEKPFELPHRWEWIRLGSLSEIKGGKRLPAGTTFSLTETPYIYMQVTNMKNGTIIHENLKYIDEETHVLIKQYTISSDDLYITIAGTIGDVGSIPEHFCGMNLTENAAKIIFRLLNKTWLKLTLRSSVVQKQFMNKTNQLAQPKLALNRVADSVFPIAPLAEQHRIVAKVDELMALCDQMETQHNNNTEAHEKLVSHLLGILTQSQNAEEFSENWQRIAAHFDILFTTETSIDVLKQTLLQLAVMGKLVPQDIGDEPARALLKRIQIEKNTLLNESKIKKSKPLSTIKDEEKPFELPQMWEWVRIGEITNFGSTSKLNIDSDTWVLDLEDIEKDTSTLLQKVRFSERRSLSNKNSFYKGDVLYGKLRPYLNKVIVADEDGVCTTEILPIRCYGPFNSDYFKTVLKSPYFIKYVNKKSYGMKMPRLGTEDGREAVFPLAPLAEQHRIVAKIDELMTLCDQIKSQLIEIKQVQQKLADVMVAQSVA